MGNSDESIPSSSKAADVLELLSELSVFDEPPNSEIHMIIIVSLLTFHSGSSP